jgi:hypothetical protein
MREGGTRRYGLGSFWPSLVGEADGEGRGHRGGQAWQLAANPRQARELSRRVAGAAAQHSAAQSSTARHSAARLPVFRKAHPCLLIGGHPSGVHTGAHQPDLVCKGERGRVRGERVCGVCGMQAGQLSCAHAFLPPPPPNTHTTPTANTSRQLLRAPHIQPDEALTTADPAGRKCRQLAVAEAGRPGGHRVHEPAQLGGTPRQHALAVAKGDAAADARGVRRLVVVADPAGPPLGAVVEGGSRQAVGPRQGSHHQFNRTGLGNETTLHGSH